MNDFITNLLQLKDAQQLECRILSTNSDRLVIQMEYPIRIKSCPLCGFRMYSKGIYTRTVNHPGLDEGQLLVLKLKQRRWQCQEPTCKHIETEQFPFIGKNRRITDSTDFRIVNAFRDYNLSAVQIAKRFHVSDTYALSVFDRYVDLSRLTFTSAICIDEVNLPVGKYKYALIIQDFFSGEPIDMLISRRKEITDPYFSAIPKEERFQVKYIISDMYAPYQKYVDTYFPKAMPVVDAFHVIKMINGKLNLYLAGLRRKFKERDQRNLDEKQKTTNHKLTLHESKEVYLLRKKKWIILANQDHIDYSAKPYRDWKFNNRLMYVSDYEQELFKLDPHLEKLRNLKEKYIVFNSHYAGDPQGASAAIDDIIKEYRNSGYKMFEETADALSQYKSAIINSFVMLMRTNPNGNISQSRLSNGPMESLNRIPKDLKRHARGYASFSHIRNRFLFATRKDAPILAYPKTIQEVKVKTEKKRGPYKRMNDNGGNTNED